MPVVSLALIERRVQKREVYGGVRRISPTQPRETIRVDDLRFESLREVQRLPFALTRLAIFALICARRNDANARSMSVSDA